MRRLGLVAAALAGAVVLARRWALREPPAVPAVRAAGGVAAPGRARRITC